MIGRILYSLSTGMYFS